MQSLLVELVKLESYVAVSNSGCQPNTHPIAIKNVLYIDNNTWACRDMEFLFECSTQYLTSKRNQVYQFLLKLVSYPQNISPFLLLNEFFYETVQ